MAPESGVVAALLDLRGLKCPLPVLKTTRAIVGMSAGETIDVRTTDPLAVIDVPHFCREHGHQLVSQEAMDGGHRFLIRKG